MRHRPDRPSCDAARRRARRVDGRMRVATRATMTLATSARVAARARPPRAPARGGTRTAAGVPDARAGRDGDGDDGDGDDDRREGARDVERAIRDDGGTTPEYLARASTPSERFQESTWGDAALAESCLRAMRVQWTHGFSSTPAGFPTCTHGFGEILAGMQPAAADVALGECFDASSASVLDPFMGGGTTLVAGQCRGWRTVGVDVSPLACFVSANRNWRADEESVRVMVETAARAVARADERADEEAGEGDAGVPRPWLPIRRAVREVTVDEPPRIAEALWFCMSVALQRTQKSQNKRRPKGRGKKNRGVGGRDAASANAEAFSKVVDEYATRLRQFKEVCDRNDPPAPLASIHNVDIRKFALAEDERVDCVLTSPPYPAVYDYLSFARKVRAGSGAVVSSSNVDGPTSSYVNTVVPGDRNWPKEWLEGEIGSRRALRSDPHAFKDIWQREQNDWLRVVADSLVPGGRAAVMVGDGANINTRTSLAAAAGLFNLRDIAGCTMKLTATMSDGALYNQARTEHLIIFEKPRE